VLVARPGAPPVALAPACAGGPLRGAIVRQAPARWQSAVRAGTGIARANDATFARMQLNWRVLGLLNLFRLLVPPVLYVVFRLSAAPRIVGEAHPQLFTTVCATYALAAIGYIALLKRRDRTSIWHAYLAAAVDIAAVTLLIHASGGAESGLAILLLVPIGGLSVIAAPTGALVSAAAATLALLVQQLGSWLDGNAAPLGFAQAGYYGAMLFVVAASGSFMARRLRETEAVVRQRDIDVANLAELSEYIVQHLRESLVVIDSEDRLRLINDSARLMLGPAARAGALLGEVSPRLLYHVERWRRRPAGAPAERAPLVAVDGGREIEASFAALGRDRPAPAIIFLEDTSYLAGRVQQTKLAALGRLSASIAHEIRNPVGAMSHAAQLLAEAPALGREEKRLTEIITGNAERVSTIIANVMKLSRRDATRPERLQIGAWLEDFVPEFSATLQLGEQRLQLVLPEVDLEVRVDPTHLHQIAWNLCDNAARHSAELPHLPAFELRVGRLPSSGRPFLEVADRGPGIPDEVAERIFEPFFTARHDGTGLGLFIARELAQCNGALLLYEPRAGGGCIFRVVFADPLRWEG
jgi:two-component system, NtrC family, sensor histidine kinase PilS